MTEVKAVLQTHNILAIKWMIFCLATLQPPSLHFLPQTEWLYFLMAPWFMMLAPYSDPFISTMPKESGYLDKLQLWWFHGHWRFRLGFPRHQHSTCNFVVGRNGECNVREFFQGSSDASKIRVLLETLTDRETLCCRVLFKPMNLLKSTKKHCAKRQSRHLQALRRLSTSS